VGSCAVRRFGYGFRAAVQSIRLGRKRSGSFPQHKERLEASAGRDGRSEAFPYVRTSELLRIGQVARALHIAWRRGSGIHMGVGFARRRHAVSGPKHARTLGSGRRRLESRGTRESGRGLQAPLHARARPDERRVVRSGNDAPRRWGPSRLLLREALQQLFPEGYRVSVPEMSCGFAISRELEEREEATTKDVIAKCFGKRHTSAGAGDLRAG